VHEGAAHFTRRSVSLTFASSAFVQMDGMHGLRVQRFSGIQRLVRKRATMRMRHQPAL
jgi:hypothetical protein